MKMILEVDDLWHKDQLIDQLLPLYQENDKVIVNAFAIPNKLGEVHMLKKVYPWIKFYIHGFEHTHFECLEWTSDKAEALINKALNMGYEPVFKAPNHALDIETAQACAKMGVLLVHNHSYDPSEVLGLMAFPGKKDWPQVKTLKAHLVNYPGCNDFIDIHPGFSKENLDNETDFVSIEDFYYGEDTYCGAEDAR